MERKARAQRETFSCWYAWAGHFVSFLGLYYGPRQSLQYLLGTYLGRYICIYVYADTTLTSASLAACIRLNYTINLVNSADYLCTTFYIILPQRPPTFR